MVNGNESNGNMENQQTEQQNAADNQKLNEYIKELLKEKNSLEPGSCPNAMRLLEDEVVKAQAKGKPIKDSKYVDIYREKPVRIAVKVLVPVKEHPRFNFLGRLLGPKGNSLKRLQEDTLTKMAILGRGSMRDKQKEEDCRNTLDPKYSHLSEELHVEIAALAPPAEAHARLAYALAELRKYLVPDINDDIRLEQMREIQSEPPRRGAGRGRGGAAIPPPRGGPIGRGVPPVAPPAFPPRPAPPTHAPDLPPRLPPAPARIPPHSAGGLLPPPQSKAKVLSILDRARQAMEEPAYPEFEEPPYGYEPPPPPTSFGGDYNGGGSDYYDGPSSYSSGAASRWKGYKAPAPPVRGYGGSGAARPAPYSRPLPK